MTLNSYNINPCAKKQYQAKSFKICACNSKKGLEKCFTFNTTFLFSKKESGLCTFYNTITAV